MLRNWEVLSMIQSPFKNLYLVCYFFFAFSYVCAEKREISFKTPVNFVAGGAGTSMLIQPARSKIECAVRCYENQDCLTFHFDKSSGNCQTKNNIIDGSIGDVYGLKIPQISGYVLYKQLDGQKYRYLKIENAPNVDKPTAASTCAADGGHLLVIEDEPMLEFTRDILRAGTDGEYWVDGEDPNGSRNYKTWNGEPLPYIKWAPPKNPDENGRACIRLVKKHDYLFADSKCYKVLGYICQVDI